MKKLKHQKLNNSGAALVLVIVVIAFVSISATILLYMSAMNFFMKTTDVKTKNNFYTGEKALEEIKAVLMADASDAVAYAYDKILVDYAMSSPEVLQAEFNKAFIDNLKVGWSANVGMAGDEDDVAEYLRKMVNTSFDPAHKLTVTADPVTSKAFKFDEAEGKLVIYGVNFTYLDSNGYETVISTDFVVKAPPINFGMDPSSEAGKLGNTIEIMDYVNYSKWTKK